MSRSVARQSVGVIRVSVAAVTFAGAVILTSAGARPAAQAARAAPNTASPGTGVIAGSVVAADSGRPVRFARITVVAPESRTSRAATTDAQGRFVVSGLPVGQYTVTASKGGLLDVAFGQQRPGSGRPGTPISLAERQRVDDLVLKMPRGGVITGTVLDEIGEPFYGVSVRALRYVTKAGIRTLAPAGAGVTDDRGLYRIPALLPGEYVVTATASGPEEFRRVEEMKAHLEATVASLRAMTPGAAADREKAILAEEKAARDRMMSITLADEPADAYVPAYYPGSSGAAAATSIALDIAEERGGVDLQILRQPVARISGVVTIAEGSLPRSTQLRLIENHHPFPYLNSITTRAAADGKFSFPPVPPGQYSIVAIASAPTGEGPDHLDFVVPGGTSRAEMEKVMEARALEVGAARTVWAMADVGMAGQPVTGVTLTLQRGMTISGTVAVESASTPVDLQRLSLTVVPMNLTMPTELPAPARVDAQGRFAIRGVMPGTYRIVPSVGVAGLTIKSSMFEGRDSLDFPVTVKPGQDLTSGVVTFTARTTELSGAISDATGQPATGYTIVAFSADRRFWGPGSRRVQGVRSATNGRFSFSALPPGEYRLAAATDVDPGQWFDPAFIETLLPTSLVVTIADGERRVQDIRIR